MSIPHTTQPKQGDTLAISLMKINMLLGGKALVSDNAERSAQKINAHYAAGGVAAGTPPIYGSWQACTYPPGCSGTLQVRSVGDPTVGTIELIGEASSVSTWDGSYSFILAYMPTGLIPSADRFALVPSSHTSGTPDSVSCAWFKPTGEIAIAYIYEKGQNPLIAWFDAISIQA